MAKFGWQVSRNRGGDRGGGRRGRGSRGGRTNYGRLRSGSPSTSRDKGILTSGRNAPVVSGTDSSTGRSNYADQYTLAELRQHVDDSGLDWKEESDKWLADFRSSSKYKGPGHNRFGDVPKWASYDSAGWYEVSNWAKDTYGLKSSTQYRSRVNRAAEIFRQRNGRWPSATELMADATLDNYLFNIASGLNTLPPVFAIDGEAYYNDPWDGPKQLRSVSNINTELGPGGIDTLLQEGTLTNSGTWREPRPEHSWTRDQFEQIMSSVGSGGGGRGGGGRGRRGGGRGRGAARAGTAFDRAQLIEAGADRWKSLMLEDPGSRIENIVDAYIAKANAFWVNQGGHLDFDTYVVNEARKTGRYRQLYSRMPSHMVEEEYINGFRRAAGQFGMNEQAALRETVAGAEANAGLEGFTERVSRTREARMADKGAFSQRLAAQFGSMPGLARS